MPTRDETRSDDAGMTWKVVNSGRNIRPCAFYDTHLFADPDSKDVVYALHAARDRSDRR